MLRMAGPQEALSLIVSHGFRRGVDAKTPGSLTSEIQIAFGRPAEAGGGTRAAQASRGNGSPAAHESGAFFR